MSKNKKSILIVILGLILIGIGFLIHLTNRYRLLLIILGFIIQIFGMTIYHKKKIIIIPILILIFGSSLIYIDYLFVAKFDRLPVLSIRQKVSKNTKIYNGVFYRVWKCDISDKKMYIDNLYKSNYYCSSKELKKIDINDFLLHFDKKYKEYKNQFVKIEGKISEIQGIKSLEMKAYEFEVDKLNGYVVFDDNVKLRFVFNGGYEKLSNYSVYDSVKVIGRITSLSKDKNDQYTIELNDSKMITTDLYNDFDIIVNSDNKCADKASLYYSDTNQNYYSSCINEFKIKYSEEDIYDMQYLLQDKKIDMKKLLSKANSKETYEDNSATLYKFDDFNILKCSTKDNNNDIIFGNKNLSKTDDYCYTDQAPKESDEVVE